MPPISSADYCVRMGEEIKSGAFWRDCFSEAIATFLLITTNLVLLQNWGGPPQGLVVQVAIGMSFSWAAIGYGLADFGGAQMNNAITFAALIRKEISLLKAVFYWVMQGAGAIGAAFFVYATTPSDNLPTNMGNLSVPDGVQWWQTLVMEAIVTAMLCFAYLGSYCVERKGYIILSSLPVGMAYGVGIFIAMPFSGASLGAWRALGPAVVTSVMDGDLQVWEDHWIYWAGPMGGALVAAILYWIFDSVDAPKYPPTYGAQTEWSYNNNSPPKRPQVMAPPMTSPLPLAPTSTAYTGGSKDILNKPKDHSDIHTVNTMPPLHQSPGFVSAYSYPPLRGSLDFNETH